MGKHPTSKKSPAQIKQAQDRPTATVTNEEKGFYYRLPYSANPEFFPHPNPKGLTREEMESFALNYSKGVMKAETEKLGFTIPADHVPPAVHIFTLTQCIKAIVESGVHDVSKNETLNTDFCYSVLYLNKMITFYSNELCD